MTAIDDLLTLLTRTPATVRALLEDLPADLLHSDEGEETFSPFSVLGHLVQSEIDDWVPRAEWILKHGPEVSLPPFDRFAHVARTADRSLDELLTEFETLRAAGLQTARDVLAAGGDLEVVGMHPTLGKVTLAELIATWVVHDLDHIAQIVRVVARQLEPDVCPSNG
ncbi:MAG: DinB family protein [Gemmatimonadota bacterium]